MSMPLTLIHIIYLCSIVTASSDGSGTDTNVWFEYKEASANFNYINNLISDYAHYPINATLQIELVRAEEEIRRGRMSLTIWVHLIWQLPLELQDTFWNSQKTLKFNLNDEAILNSAPQTVFKNALYLHEHKTPLLNSILHINQSGYFHTHSKMTVDIPCVRFSSLISDYLTHTICGQQLNQTQSVRSIENVVCELRYGSYIRDKSLLNLDWAYEAFDGYTAPCSNELIPHCLIQNIQTFKTKTVFVGEEYDELLACFLLDHRNTEQFGF